jgi:hypothetical protein
MPDLNELIRQRGVRFRSGKRTRATPAQVQTYDPNGYQALKKRWMECVGTLARARGFSVPPGCWAFTYLFVDATKRRDPSNISSGARKFVEDGLVKAKLMDGDGWGTVHEIHDFFHRGEPEGILLSVSEAMVPEQEMLLQYERMNHGEKRRTA